MLRAVRADHLALETATLSSLGSAQRIYQGPVGKTIFEISKSIIQGFH